MKSLTFTALGEPIAQPRVKATRRGNFTGVYTPKTADEWKARVRSAFLCHRDGYFHDGPIALTLAFAMPRPRAHLGRSGVKITAPNWHTVKPDADNLTKAVKDALTNAGAWKDDSRVAKLYVTKRYCLPGYEGCLITISEIC